MAERTRPIRASEDAASEAAGAAEMTEAHRAHYVSLVLDAIPSGIAYCRLPDPGAPSGDFFFRDVNAAFERIAGVCRSEAAGRCAWELFRHEGAAPAGPRSSLGSRQERLSAAWSITSKPSASGRGCRHRHSPTATSC
jgi:PAS domain-containing protein